MRAIVLSAGQGKRLLPLTAEIPKCLLPVDAERTVLEFQLATLARCGIERVSVVSGFGLDRVERFLAASSVPGLDVEVLFNPFFAVSDNLATCWVAREKMDQEFLLVNGDTLFEPSVLRRLQGSPAAPITVTVDHKASYDDDDMKVSLEGTRLRAIGKTLPRESVNGESIGMLCFRGAGVRIFRDALEEAIRRPDSLRAWYLSVVNELAQRTRVETVNVRGLWWREIDAPEDLEGVRASYAQLTSEPARAPRDAARAVR